MTAQDPAVYPVDDSRRKSALVSRITVPALLGAMIGFLAWPHAIWLTPLTLLLLPILNKRSWLVPFSLMLGYHLATTYGLIKGTSVFFLHAGLFLGIGFWSLSSLAFALPYLAYPYIALYFRGSGFGAVVATIITSAVSTILPPLGIIGWTSPWLGVLPFGWSGVLVLIGAIYAVGRWGGDGVAWCCILLFWATFSGISWAATTVPVLKPLFANGTGQAPSGWIGIDTHLGHLRSNLSYVDASMEMAPMVLADLHAGDKVVLLPETVAGLWLPGTRAIWRPVIRWTAQHPGQTVLLGAAVPFAGRSCRRQEPLAGCKPHGRAYLDALVKIQSGHQTILPDHIPVPFSMWHPWHARGSFRMDPFSGNPETTKIDHKKVGYLICYEQLLMWPALDLYPHGIQVLLAPANDWWARGTDIPAIQRASAKAWAAFFGVPVLFAVNQ
ncbi:MAG: carbon-nitrogen hydrolase family protein [Acidithiobacillus sp.]